MQLEEVCCLNLFSEAFLQRMLGKRDTGIYSRFQIRICVHSVAFYVGVMESYVFFSLCYPEKYYSWKLKCPTVDTFSLVSEKLESLRNESSVVIL